jgi:putative protease
MSANQTESPIGEVTHYYSQLGVAIVKFSQPVRVGDRIHFRGATTDFAETISSMQFEHQPVEEAMRDQEVGIKVSQKVREGDKVYRAL